MKPYGGKRKWFTKREAQWCEKHGDKGWRDFGLSDVSKKRARRSGKKNARDAAGTDEVAQ